MDTKCAHPACTCNEATVEAAGAQFCSNACAAQEQKNLADAMCACAHPGCGRTA